jgi:hypothetical protein
MYCIYFYFTSLICFEQHSAHHQENQLYQYIIWMVINKNYTEMHGQRNIKFWVSCLDMDCEPSFLSWYGLWTEFLVLIWTVNRVSCFDMDCEPSFLSWYGLWTEFLVLIWTVNRVSCLDMDCKLSFRVLIWTVNRVSCLDMDCKLSLTSIIYK